MAVVEFPSLPDEELARVQVTTREWSRLHPSPDTPVLLMVDGSSMTPRDIADALQRPDTPRGRTLVRMLSVYVHGNELKEVPFEGFEPTSIDDVLAHFESDISLWRENFRG